jgi:hypothetical protein
MGPLFSCDLVLFAKEKLSSWILKVDFTKIKEFHPVTQGGPTFFFPQAKNIFPVGYKGQQTIPGTIFENSQFSLKVVSGQMLPAGHQLDPCCCSICWYSPKT